MAETSAELTKDSHYLAHKLVTALKADDHIANECLALADALVEKIKEDHGDDTSKRMKTVLSLYMLATMVVRTEGIFAEQLHVGEEDPARYPKGKLRQDDEGLLESQVYIKDNVAYLDFGKNVSWLALDKPYMRKFLDTLEEKYKELT